MEPMPKASKKSTEAFARFVRDHQASLRSFLRLLGVQPDAVDDLAQETFLVAYRELDSFDDERDFGKWLRGIARNLVRNETRKVARRSRILHNDLTDHLLAQSENANEEERYEDHDFKALRDCVEQLPDKCRTMIARRYADEWTSQYLADQFEMTAGAVRLSLMRIRRQLKTCIEKRIASATTGATANV